MYVWAAPDVMPDRTVVWDVRDGVGRKIETALDCLPIVPWTSILVPG